VQAYSSTLMAASARPFHSSYIELLSVLTVLILGLASACGNKPNPTAAVPTNSDAMTPTSKKPSIHETTILAEMNT